MKALLIILFLLMPIEVFAGDFRGAHRPRPYNNRINLYLHDGNRSTSYGSGLSGLRVRTSGPIMRDGSIKGPFKNPDVDARKQENLTACIYAVNGSLLYEREGKVCPYKYVDQNQARVERRRQAWLKAQARAQ